MFNDSIFNTPFTKGHTDDIFKNVDFVGVGFGDDAPRTLLRALVSDRVEVGEVFKVRSFRGQVSPGWEIPEDSRLLFLVTGGIGNTNLSYDVFSSAAERHGYARSPKVSKYCERYFRAECYINENLQRSIVICSPKTVAEQHFLLSALPAFLPWLFRDKPLTEEENKVLSGLTQKTSAPFMKALDELAKKLDFVSVWLNNVLGNFESLQYQNEIEVVRRRNNELLELIKDCEREIAESLNEMNSNNARLMGLELKSEDAKSGAMLDYFKSAKDNLELIDVTKEGRISFLVKGYLAYFNEASIITVIDNRRGFAYLPGRGFDLDDMYLLLRAVFVDQTVRIRMCAAYEMDTCRVEACRNYDYRALDTYVINPHIEYYGCLGGYRPQIVEYLKKGDYIGAIESAVASCANINTFELQTVKPFIHQTFYSTRRVFELPGGRIVTPKEAIEYLKGEAKNA